jgi:lysophospholipase L1-like esterase
MRRTFVCLSVVAALAMSACSSGGGSGSASVDAGGPPDTGLDQQNSSPVVGGPSSIVQLGDSIASGEGTLYGYTYDASSQEWTGGNVDAPWPPPYPECHDSPDAYSALVGKAFGAKVAQFACTGATFANGITAPETDSDGTLRPAEFGNWQTKTDLNAEYDAAAPDLVLVTLGADDVQFTSIVEDCIKNGYEYYFDIEKLRCTTKNPGSTITDDFVDFLPTLQKNYGTLVSWIQARAEANQQAKPKVVITNYADPLPSNRAKCPDTSWLYPAQVQYLSSLVAKMNQTIANAVEAIDDPDVVLADISQAYEPQGQSHIWCTDDPWAYGLSIYSVTDPSSFDSQAPFHPTPDGQQSIAEHVVPVIRALYGTPPSTTSTSSASPGSTTSTSGSASTTTSAPSGTSTSTSTSSTAGGTG